MDLLDSLRENHRAFDASLSWIEAVVPQGSPADRRWKWAARELLRELEPQLHRHEDLERRLLFPQLRGWSDPALDATVDRDEAEHAHIDREMSECERLLSPGAGGRKRHASEEALAAKIHNFAGLLRDHLSREERLIYVWAEKLLPADRREQINERAYEEEFQEYLDKGGGD